MVIPLILAEVASAVDGAVHGCDGTEVVSGSVEFDSRRVLELSARGPGQVAAVAAMDRRLLVKVSRVVGLERVAEGLLGPLTVGSGR